MKKISYLINIILFAISIFLGIKIYERNNKVEEEKEYYYECSNKIEKEIYTQLLNYRIDINKDYSIKKLETATTYLYNKFSFEDAKKGYLSSNSKVTIDDEKYSITVPGDNSNVSEKMWAISFVEQLQNNNFTCILKND